MPWRIVFGILPGGDQNLPKEQHRVRFPVCAVAGFRPNHRRDRQVSM